MTLVLVLVGGWFLLSVVCFAMGTGMFRPAAPAPVERAAVRVPAPRTPATVRERVPA